MSELDPSIKGASSQVQAEKDFIAPDSIAFRPSGHVELTRTITSRAGNERQITIIGTPGEFSLGTQKRIEAASRPMRTSESIDPTTGNPRIVY